MPKFIKKRSHKRGSSPGTLVYIGEKRKKTVRMNLFQFDEQVWDEKELKNISPKSIFLKSKKNVNWLNIDGVHDISEIENIGEFFHIHKLTLEDIVNTSQRPKIEAYDDYLFIVLHMIEYQEKENTLTSEQISFVLTDSILISFQEKPGDLFDSVRERIRKGKGKVRKEKEDYLTYALIDSIVDHYFYILEKIGEKIETIEEDLIHNPETDMLHSIHALKREMIFLRKKVWPIREIINQLIKGDHEIINPSTHIYLRDVYDHTIQIIDTIESYRDLLSGLMDLYLSRVSHKMNEVMKVLTIISTIFIPITFIAGVYGMNFKVMPELEWPFGYFTALGIMGIIFLLMVIYFWRKRWF